MIRDIRILFEQGDDYCKQIREGNFWNDNYIKYQINGDRRDFRRGWLHIESADWIKKKATVNPKSRDDKCFQYAVTVTLTKSHAERVSSIKPFINKYNWDGIKYPSKIDD